MGPIGPMMTRVWTRIERAVLREIERDDDPGIGRHDDTYAHDYGASVRMMDLEPALWEDGDFEDETTGLWNYVG